ncbi:hypothetical protein [Bacillus nakamurai]|nr:hypothetical protein [Bacillus nakamurai]MCC9021217.1 hypothetical protein [Bacillus nakamurai]
MEYSNNRKIHKITLPVSGPIGSVHIYLIEGKEPTLIEKRKKHGKV